MSTIPTSDPCMHLDPSKYNFQGSETLGKGASVFLIYSKEDHRWSFISQSIISAKLHSSWNSSLSFVLSFVGNSATKSVIAYPFTDFCFTNLRSNSCNSIAHFSDLLLRHGLNIRYLNGFALVSIYVTLLIM